jgi:hypothetical protein
MDIDFKAAYAVEPWPGPGLTIEVPGDPAPSILPPTTIPFEYPVSDGLANSRGRPDGVTIPAIWVAFALSLLIHIAVLWQWLPKLRLLSPDEAKPGEANGSLLVRLAPPPSPPPSPKQAVQPPAPAIKAPPPTVAARPRPTPRAIAFNRSPSNIQAPPSTVPAVTAPAAARPQADGDLTSYIEARRGARAQSAPDASAQSPASAQPLEDDKARSKRIVAANLGAQQAQAFGYDPKQGGGVFQITRMGYDYAEFAFFGWNKDIRRDTKQQIEVRKGDNSDIRIAVVRKMISIIREYEQEDFRWESYRLGRSLVLSARARDNAGLEEFMLREFFDDPRLPQ